MVYAATTTQIEYVWPTDGHDICESCNYLTVVHTAYGVDDGSRVVPLCVNCAIKMEVQK